MIDTVETAKLTTANRTSLEAATAMLIAGAMFGLVFGFLLQKGGVGKYNVLIGQLLLQDWTVVKIILTAIVVGMIGVFTLHRFAKVNLHMLTGEVLVAMLEENLERTFARDPYDQMGGYVKRGLGFNAYIKIENPPGQRVQQVFVGDEELHLGRFYPTAFVTEQGVANKYGRNRQKHTERSIDALRAYLARHRLLRAELRGTFVAV